jgi:uncharacterized protein
MSERNIVGWFEIYVQDLNRAKKFYETVFKVQLTKLPSGVEMWAFPMKSEAPGCPGALVHMPGVESKMGGTIVYFHTQDCAVEAERAAQNGGKIFKPKFSIGEYGFISLVYDCEGNMIGIHSMR